MGRVWVTWNVRGLGRSSKWREVKKILDRERPKIICLRDTKLNDGRESILEEWVRQ